MVSASAIRAHRRTSRGSGSFMSPGSLGDVVEKGPARPHTVAEAKGRKRTSGKGKSKEINATPERTPSVPSRSPQIQVEFTHDSLLQSLPEDFLRHGRKGSGASSADGIARSQLPQVSIRSK